MNKIGSMTLMGTIESQLAWIAQFHTNEPHLGLARVNQLLTYLDRPQEKLKVIHIGGTNGKGSTIAMLDQLLQTAGLKVGVFSSPHIIAFNEQLRINSQMVSDEALARLLQTVYDVTHLHLDDPQLAGLTEFEVMTAAAFYYFWQEQVDVAIFEVGLGGDLDATNVCQPILTGITTIGLDHVAILGDSLTSIARHKAGIIKAGIPIVTGHIAPEALNVIEAVARTHRAPLWQNQVAYHYCDQGNSTLGKGHLFTYRSNLRQAMDFTLGLLGQHQVDNGAMAVALMDVYCQLTQQPLLTQAQINQALQQTVWPARLEVISQTPLIILDGAHNHHAMVRLIANMNEDFADWNKAILFSCIQTKDIRAMIEDLQQIEHSQLTLTTFEDDRVVAPAVMQAQGLAYQGDWRVFIDEYLTQTHSDKDLLLITGSLYFISQARPYLLDKIRK